MARSLALWLICMGFFAAWKHLGYLYTAPLFMLALGLLMGARKIVLLVCLAGLGPVMYLVFEKLLKVGL